MKIRKIYLIFLFLLTADFLFAQVLVNYGGNIHINEGSTLVVKGIYHNLAGGTLENSGDINIFGNWVNDADTGDLLKNTSGTVRFQGNEMQLIAGTRKTWFHKIVLQNDVTLKTETAVTSELLLDNALLFLNGSDLVLSPAAGIVGFSNMSYIVADSSGRLLRTVKNEDVEFPVGTETSYAPAILHNSGTEDVFGVRVFNDVLTGGTSGGTLPEIAHCVNNTWSISEQTPGGSDMQATFFWDTVLEGAAFNRNLCGIGQYKENGWEPQTSGAAAGNGLFSFSRPGITAPSSFAVGDTASPMALFLNLTLDVSLFLEGPYNGTAMNTILNPDDIPLAQPYNISPWNYPGTESVAAIPEGVVDWVLVELRDAPDAPSATPETVIDTKAAFLKDDGKIVGMDGVSYLSFNDSIEYSLFVVIMHRNHLAVMSAIPVTQTGNIYSYDFTTPEGQAYGADAQNPLGDDVFGMISGDADGNGVIDSSDRFIWIEQAGTKGYRASDFNLNGQVNNPDKNSFWLPNRGMSSQVPE
jgi:hypothetical protein